MHPGASEDMTPRKAQDAEVVAMGGKSQEAQDRVAQPEVDPDADHTNDDPDLIPQLPLGTTAPELFAPLG